MYSVSAIAGFFGCLIACPSRFARGVRSWFRSRSRLVTEADCVSTLAIAFSLSYFYHADCHVALWKLLEPLLLRFFSSIDRALRPRRSTQNVADHSGFAPMTKTRSSTSPLPPPAAASHATRHAILTPLLQLRYSRPFERVFCSGTRPQIVSFRWPYKITPFSTGYLFAPTATACRCTWFIRYLRLLGCLAAFVAFRRRFALGARYGRRPIFTLFTNVNFIRTISVDSPLHSSPHFHVALRKFVNTSWLSPLRISTSSPRLIDFRLQSFPRRCWEHVDENGRFALTTKPCSFTAPLLPPTAARHAIVTSLIELRYQRRIAAFTQFDRSTKQHEFSAAPQNLWDLSAVQSVSCKSCYLKLT
jgi:hypothetical protein